MGNENGKELDVAQPDGEIHDKCKNGGVNGISVTITANGHTVEVPTKIPVEIQEESPPPPPEETKPTEYVVLDTQEELTKVEESIPTPDLIIPVENVSPKEEKVSLFSKMFKKKTAPAEIEKELSDVTDGRNDQQLPNGKVHEPHENGGLKLPTADDPGIQLVLAPPAVMEELSVPQDSTEYAVLESLNKAIEVSVQSPAPSEDVKPKEEKVNMFSKWFKIKTVAVKETEQETEKPKEDETDVSPALDQQQANGDVHNEQSPDIVNESSAKEVKTTEYVVLESQSAPTEAEEATVQTLDPCEEVKPREEKVSLFSKMFKKKSAPVAPQEKEEKTEKEKEETDAVTSDSDQQLEPEKQEIPEADVQKVEEREESESPEKDETDSEGAENVVENQSVPEEENPVMNFFKTLVTPTKSSKKEAPASEAPKDQPKPPETQPAPATTTTTVAQVCDPPAAPKGMPAPPPPPPEPPRAEPAAKAKADEPKAAAKDGPKGTSARDTLSRLFRSKTDFSLPLVDEAQTQQEQQDEPLEATQTITEDQTDSHVPTAEVTLSVVAEEPEQKPDASKAATLEAAAKPAPAPAPAQDEKKPEAKKSLFSFLKPKASELKVAPVPAPAAAAATDPGPAKEEAPKAAKTEATAEVKPAAAAPPGAEEAISPPKKTEKRNSITLFFKNLSQKRPSTDAGVPPEAAPAPSAEKTK